jgi:hypothetical protein
VRGEHALHDYWMKALEGHRSLGFTIDRMVWDAATGELAIIYTSETAAGRRRVWESLTFGTGGLVTRGEVFHGIGGCG